MNRENNLDKSKVRKKTIRLLIRIVAIVAAFLALIYIGARIFFYVGGKRLYAKATSNMPTLITEELPPQEIVTESGNTVTWKDGWVRYDGEIYEYNEDILTFLIMGIDKKGKVEETADEISGGQSDALFLMVVNPHISSVKIISIDRNTMTDVVMVGQGADGGDITAQLQITLQHGYGDGKEKSCELTQNAVSRLFYDLPIHGYLSVNYGAIPIINDAVGGVEVTIPSDAENFEPGWSEGAKILLIGDSAITFIKRRDTTVFGSAMMRAQRQKQYIDVLSGKIVQATKADITKPLSMYASIKEYTVTNISADEISYLASMLTSYKLDTDAIYSLEGETVMGEKFEEFYPDETALKAMIIEIFYEKVELD